MNGRPLLLLTVPGRRSGTLRTVPVLYFDHSGGYLVVGTGMGSKTTPQWFRNLQAAGRARIRIREREHEVDAHVAADPERAQLWGRSPPRHLASRGFRYALAVSSRLQY